MKKMGSTHLVANLFLCCFLSISYPNLQAATPTQEEMWTVIQHQQKLIDELILKLDQSETRLAEVEINADEARQNIEASADAFEEIAAQQVTMTASKRTSIGGYGELHYNNLDDDNDAIGGDDSRDRVDYHRFVLYFGHDFTDKLRFFSELEVEHSLTGEGAPGEVELEQAWLFQCCKLSCCHDGFHLPIMNRIRLVQHHFTLEETVASI